MPKLSRCIGVIHLPSLPGAPGGGRKGARTLITRALEIATSEAKAMERAGMDGVMLENFGDAPFYADQVPAETIASMSMIASEVTSVVNVPVGINILRNDARAALSVAAVSGARLIRVNVLCGVVASDQGMIEGQAAFLLRERLRLGADVVILADVHVKHARSLSSSDLVQSIEETAGRGGADAVIVTGTTTGRQVGGPDLVRAAEVCRALKIPLYVGSGATPENVGQLLAQADGVIVGSTLKKGGKAGNPLDLRRLKAFMTQVRKTGRSGK